MKAIGLILMIISMCKLLIINLISSSNNPIRIPGIDIEEFRNTTAYIIMTDMFIGLLGGACLYYL